MITIYVKTECSLCATVKSKINELGIEAEYKNIADDAVAAELVEKGGKKMVPYLVDGEKNVSMYESGDIVNFLNEHYGGKKGKIIVSKNVCTPIQKQQT